MMTTPGTTAQEALYDLATDHAAGTLDALRDARWITEQAERVTAQQVSALREQGLSWSQIGTALGISKQAAQQRYGK